MTQLQQISRVAMASRFRRRRMCVLHGAVPVPAALETVSGHGARLTANAAPVGGSEVRLHHPVAGSITARVRSCADGVIEIDFDGGEAAIAFALAATAADMTRG